MQYLWSAGGKKITYHFHHKHLLSADNQMHIIRPLQEIKHFIKQVWMDLISWNSQINQRFHMPWKIKVLTMFIQKYIGLESD